MNPSTNETGPGLQLPAPVMGGGAPEAAPQQPFNNQEAMPPTHEQQASPQPQMPPMAQPTSDLVAGLPLPVAPATSVATPAVADDQDLIEKEWVHKAKQIVADTHDDPYRQSQELTVVKSDYLHKRYNKSIKMGE